MEELARDLSPFPDEGAVKPYDSAKHLGGAADSRWVWLEVYGRKNAGGEKGVAGK